MSYGGPPERVVIKIGTSSLITDGRPCPAKLAALAEAVIRLRDDGTRPVLIGSGAIAAGHALLRDARAKGAGHQVAAAVGQAVLFEAFRRALADRGLIAAQILLTPLDLMDPPHHDGVRTVVEEAWETGLVPVVNENDAVMVRNNDVLGAMLAVVLRAERLVLLTDVAGLYESDPREGAGARRVAEVEAMTPEVEKLAGLVAQGRLGTGGMRSKLCAAWIATTAGVATVIAAAGDEEAVLRAVRGTDLGTFIHPREPARELDLGRLWRSFSTPPAGQVLCRPEVISVLGNGGPLTLGHVIEFGGEFERGAIVDVVVSDSGLVARGRMRRSGEESQHAGEDAIVMDHVDYVSLLEV